MTTLIGIVTNDERIVLASDETATYKRHQEHKHGIAITDYLGWFKKIEVSNDQKFAIAMSGIADELYSKLLGEVLSNEKIIEKALKKKYFAEFKKLHDQRFGGEDPNMESVSNLLIAANFNGKPGLFKCYSGGRIKEIRAEALGSGQIYADPVILEYFEKIPYGKKKEIDTSDAIDLVVAALSSAHRDPGTRGLDITIIEKDKITPFNELITEHYKKANIALVKKIKEPYK